MRHSLCAGASPKRLRRAAPDPQEPHEGRLLLGVRRPCGRLRGPRHRRQPPLPGGLVVVREEVADDLQSLGILRLLQRRGRLGQRGRHIAACGRVVDPILVRGASWRALALALGLALLAFGIVILLNVKLQAAALLRVVGPGEEVLHAAQERADAALDEADGAQGDLLDADVSPDVQSAVGQDCVGIRLVVAEADDALRHLPVLLVVVLAAREGHERALRGLAHQAVGLVAEERRGRAGEGAGLLDRGEALLHALAEGRHSVGQVLDHEEGL
mmetsp:Transcript_90921/g.282857  ORF Transcript_90921/g.282857 Transcript_90921/m.282857 type:complete len:272 (-) Transcript_90921:301-1116(-)